MRQGKRTEFLGQQIVGRQTPGGSGVQVLCGVLWADSRVQGLPRCTHPSCCRGQGHLCKSCPAFRQMEAQGSELLYLLLLHGVQLILILGPKWRVSRWPVCCFHSAAPTARTVRPQDIAPQPLLWPCNPAGAWWHYGLLVTLAPVPYCTAVTLPWCSRAPAGLRLLRLALRAWRLAFPCET